MARLPSNKETTSRRNSTNNSLSPREQQQKSSVTTDTAVIDTAVTDAAVTDAASTLKERHRNTALNVGVQSRSSSPKAITNSTVRASGIPITTTPSAVNHNTTKTRSMAKSFIEPSTASSVMKAAAATAIASFHKKARVNGKESPKTTSRQKGTIHKSTERKKKLKQINVDESSSGALSPRTVKHGRKGMKKKSRIADALARSAPTRTKGVKSSGASPAEEEDDDDDDDDDDSESDDDDSEDDDEEEESGEEEESEEESSEEEEEEEEQEDDSSEEEDDDSQHDSTDEPMTNTTKRTAKRKGIKAPFQSVSTRHRRGMPPATLESRSFGNIEEIEGKTRRAKQLESQPQTDGDVEESTVVPVPNPSVGEGRNDRESKRTHLNQVVNEQEQDQEGNDGKKKRSHRVLHVADSTTSSSSNNRSPVIPVSSRKSRQPSFNAGGTLTSFNAVINTDWTNVNALLRKQGVPNVEAQRKSLSPSKIQSTEAAMAAAVAAVAIDNQITYPENPQPTLNTPNPSPTT